MKTRPNQTASERAPYKANNSSTEAQRTRLLAALRLAPISTIEARRDLDIMMPAARVHELRHRFGFDIDTVWVSLPTDSGKLHTVALYVLKASKVKSC